MIEDDVGGAREATAHLLGHGHRRVAFIGDTLEIATTARRLKGYREALRGGGHPARAGPGRPGGRHRQRRAASSTVQLLGSADPPTAIFSSNARCSLGIVPALQSVDRSDVGLISFGDFPLAGVAAAAADRGRPGPREGRPRRRHPALRADRPARAPPQAADRPPRDARPPRLLLGRSPRRGRHPRPA